jgi:hypothetical protein
VNQPPDLSPLATELADAIEHRHALGRLADGGTAVPAEIARQAEHAVRAAEAALLQARVDAA